MKKFITLISLTTLLVVLSMNTFQLSAKSLEANGDLVYVWVSPDLIEISNSWVDEYSRLHPEIKIEVKIAGKKDVSMIMENPDYLGFFSDDFIPHDKSTNVWKMIIGRDIIVPVMNTKNPFLNDILQKGITAGQFAEVFSKPANQSWSLLLDDEQLSSINCARFGEQKIDEYLSAFLQTNRKKINYTKVSGKDEFIHEILNNPYSIGFCRLTDILTMENQGLIDGISLIPIDINNNKKLDYFEDIYNNYADLARGIWIGKYPRALYGNVFAVSADQPTEDTHLAFLQWVITGGQQYLFSAGYSELVINERKSKIENLTSIPFPIVEEQTNTNTSGMILIFIGLLVAGGLILFLILSYFSNKTEEVETVDKRNIPVFGEHSVNAPTGLFFDKSHTWAFMEKEGSVRIGIDDFLQHVTGTITKVKMKNPGEKIKKGDPFLSLIQHGKQLDIKSPVSGTILESNPGLQIESSMLNNSPYGEGWVYMIRSDNWLKELKSLFMGEAYQIWLQYEFSRLKDFLSFKVKSKSALDLQVVLQDGGEIKDHILEEFGPQVWEEFQNEFINGNI